MGNCQQYCPPGFPGPVANDPNQTSMVVGCGPPGSVQGLVFCPDNGEWESAGGTGVGTCTYDSLKPGCGLACDAGQTCGKDGLAGHCMTSGEQVKCQRRAGSAGYKADPKSCCQGGVATIGNVTCDPKYRDPLGPACLALAGTPKVTPYPDGTMVRCEVDGYIYRVEEGKKRFVPTMEILKSYGGTYEPDKSGACVRIRSMPNGPNLEMYKAPSSQTPNPQSGSGGGATTSQPWAAAT
jgi:hypothetical protein